MVKIDEFLKNALSASDLVQGFVDKATDELEKLNERDRKALQTLLEKTKPKSAEEAAGIAVLQFLVKIPLASKVDKIYHSKKCEKLFDEAREIFPGYNGEQAPDASDWIFERLIEGKRLSQKERDELFESIYAGLT
jgi:hypothetical protein